MIVEIDMVIVDLFLEVGEDFGKIVVGVDVCFIGLVGFWFVWCCEGIECCLVVCKLRVVVIG